MIRRGVHLALGLLGAERLGGPAVRPRGFHDLRDVSRLVGRRGEGELAGLLEVGGDPVPGERLLDRGEVLAADALEGGHLVRPAGDPVLDPLCERGIDEAAVAPGGAEGDPLALEQDDLPMGVLLARQQGGPQAGQPATDHEQIGLDLLLERGAGLRRVWLVEPERVRLGVGVGGVQRVPVNRSQCLKLNV